MFQKKVCAVKQSLNTSHVYGLPFHPNINSVMVQQCQKTQKHRSVNTNKCMYLKTYVSPVDATVVDVKVEGTRLFDSRQWNYNVVVLRFE